MDTIKILPHNKEPGPDGMTADLYKMFQQELLDMLVEVYKDMWEGGPNLPLGNEAYIKLIPKPGKGIT